MNGRIMCVCQWNPDSLSRKRKSTPFSPKCMSVIPLSSSRRNAAQSAQILLLNPSMEFYHPLRLGSSPPMNKNKFAARIFGQPQLLISFIFITRLWRWKLNGVSAGGIHQNVGCYANGLLLQNYNKRVQIIKMDAVGIGRKGGKKGAGSEAKKIL